MFKSLEGRTRKWVKENNGGVNAEVDPGGRKSVVWFHDESTFYANDHRRLRWVHKSETAVPRAKGEGASLMVADFVSADYGWLRSPDGTESARVLFKAGKAQEGYFTSEDIQKQNKAAMDILKKHYPNEDHVFVYDNATTHLKRADGALSARQMPKGPSDKFSIERTVMGLDGKPVHETNGTLLKEKIRMVNGHFSNGEEQQFYYPDDHEKYPGFFKGITVILQERGFTGLTGRGGKLLECKGFNCKVGVTDCCCRRILYCQPDFQEVESILETLCRSCGFQVLFLPKFHCELNFIEQCWGHAKRRYRKYPVSSKEADLEVNLIHALDEVPLDSMRR
jgi:hypothetical protein